MGKEPRSYEQRRSNDNNNNHHQGPVLSRGAIRIETETSSVAEVLESLKKLILDGDASVQRAACRALGTFFYQHFAEVYPHLRRWAEEEDPALRRAVAFAVMEAIHPFRFDLAEHFLKLIELLLPDKTPQIRWAVGPKAIAEGLLPAYPDDTFEYLTKWSTVHDEQVLWNVAMGLSGAAAIRRTAKALIILRRLALDERRYVWRAVASAMWRLGRKDPAPVLAELRRWLSEDDRAHVARVALKHI